jgi:hypothetical protein
MEPRKVRLGLAGPFDVYHRDGGSKAIGSSAKAQACMT